MVWKNKFKKTSLDLPLEHQKLPAMVVRQGMNSLGSQVLNHLGFFWLQVTEANFAFPSFEKGKYVSLNSLITNAALGIGVHRGSMI